MTRLKAYTRLRRAVAAAAMLLAAIAPSPAGATAALRCASDPPVKVEVLANLTYGMGGRLLALDASLDAAVDGAAPDLAHHSFTISDMTQWWEDDGSLLLRLYWERGSDAPFGSIELAIATKGKADEYDVLSGRVTVTIIDMPAEGQAQLQAESAIECIVG